MDIVHNQATVLYLLLVWHLLNGVGWGDRRKRGGRRREKEGEGEEGRRGGREEGKGGRLRLAGCPSLTCQGPSRPL